MLPLPMLKPKYQNQRITGNKKYFMKQTRKESETNQNQESVNIFQTTSNISSKPMLRLEDSTISQTNFDLQGNFLIRKPQYTEKVKLESSFQDDPCAKRKSRFFSPDAVRILKRWFIDNIENPYPDETNITGLANEAQISTKQVRKWFANKRVRSNKCFKQIYRNKRMHELNFVNKSQTKFTNDEYISEETINSYSSSPFKILNNGFSENVFSKNESSKSNGSTDFTEFPQTNINEKLINYGVDITHERLVNLEELENTYAISQPILAALSYPYLISNLIKQSDEAAFLEFIDMKVKCALAVLNVNYSTEKHSSSQLSLNLSEYYKVDQPIRKARVNFASISDLVN